MGSFSWYASDTNRAIRSDEPFPVYVLRPDGEPLLEVEYEGYGVFGGQDIYELVADWNRKYLAEHPEFLIAQYNAPPKRVDEFEWYPAYADLSKTRAEVEKELKETKATFSGLYRSIGIAIACYDFQNFSLPFPIKLVEKPVPYQAAGASVGDPEQGWGAMDRFDNRDKTVDNIVQRLAEHGLALQDFSDVDDGLTVRLGLEKPMEDRNRVGETFYRYGIGDYKFWFSQNTEDGNIYSVTVAPRSKAAGEFGLYVTHEGMDDFYPNVFEVHGYAPTMTSGQAREYAQRLEKACAVLDKIEEFFKTSKHYEIYRKAQEKSADMQAERLPSSDKEVTLNDKLSDAKARSTTTNVKEAAGKTDYVKEQ